jgi:ATP-dependent helicase/nuclease subunit A
MEGLLAAESPVALDDLVEGSPPEPGARLAAEESLAIKAAVRLARDLLRGLAAVDEEAVGAVFEAARDLGARARERLLGRGFISFDGLLRLTRDLLAEKPALRRALARRHRRILVDEFQDTDPLQYEILFYLGEADGPQAGDAYETDLAPGRLFIVGDPKQSIYRFRGADIAAFHRAVQHLLRRGGSQLTLTTSFRSPEPLLRPINTLFDGWIGEGGGWRDDYEPPYDPITSGRPPGATAPRLEIWSVPEEGDAEARRAAEGAAIASWIAVHAGRPSDEGRRLHFRDIAILLRALTNAGLYAAALRRAGIPFVVDGGKDFYERPEVGDLLAFLRAVANPNDAPALLAVLRSPLGAVPDEELARFASAGGRLDQAREARPDLDALPAVRRALGLVDAFRTRTRGWPADALIQEALDGTPLPLLHAATHDGAQRLANLRKLAAAAQRHARLGLSLGETLRIAEEEFETSIGEGESPLADETIDAVRVLSIHKAKGLEYPVVVVPDVGRESERRPHDDAAVAAWSAGRSAALHPPDSPPGNGRVAVRLPGGRSNSAWVLHEIEGRRHESAEEKRLFYVACTRARERLILVNSHRSGNAAWRARLAALGYTIVDGAWPAEGLLQDGLVEHKVIRPEPPPRLALVAPPVEALVAAAAAAGSVAHDAAAGAGPPLHWPSGTHPRDRDEADLEEPARPAPRATAGPVRGTGAGRATGAGPGPVARLAGLAVHAALSAWLSQREAADANGGPSPPDRGRLLDLGRREARLAVDDASPPGRRRVLLQAVTSEVGEILAAFLGTPLPSRLAAAEILGTEVPILFRDGGGRTWTGACDLLFREGGSVVVADFKTDRVDVDATTAAERYRDQIGVYVEAVRRAMPGERPRGEVLFVRSGDAVVLLPDPADAG